MLITDNTKIGELKKSMKGKNIINLIIYCLNKKEDKRVIEYISHKLEEGFFIIKYDGIFTNSKKESAKSLNENNLDCNESLINENFSLQNINFNNNINNDIQLSRGSSEILNLSTSKL